MHAIRRWMVAPLAALLVVRLCLSLAHAAPACATDDSLLPPGKPLPGLAHRLSEGAPLDIVAVGSATMLGPRIDIDASFPGRLVELLRAARPAARIRLFARAERGASAVDLLTILRQQIGLHPASLVLWQTGTAEAARGRPSGEFEQTLREGVGAALAAGGEIVLIDPPYSRLLASRGNPARYQAAFMQAAAPPGAVVFSRYALTRRWVDSGQLDLEHAVSGERKATLVREHECLAEALAHDLLAAAALSDAAAMR